MRRALASIGILASAALLAGCGQSTSPDPSETAIPVEPDGGIGDGAGPPEGSADTIPMALYGRWGISPGDCTDANGDAKGSIEISADGLKFYESRAVVDTVATRSDDGIRATYAFTGEGQEWSRDIELELADGGTSLIRTEFGPEAIPEPLTYAKCPVETNDAQ
ncbi:hypothetical protein [Qipengyuania oceanensis]|uniref:Uncharacterized protein n=1 Tax=Qipengyuania oceanensis TaxID=1463597 RepID=A0A844YGV7_9SPHN|nr:hypothetical protein [Qipengyuania oceanensis]MXO62569.1 hypothetical protein [Qipengyuania oceanensis]